VSPHRHGLCVEASTPALRCAALLGLNHGPRRSPPTRGRPCRCESFD
jgi:hypothetical protein